MTKIKGLLLANIALSTLTIGSRACAQNAVAANGAAAQGSQEPLGDIVVTARKREESLSRIPETVSVLGAKTLEQRNITNLGSMQTLVPAFSFNQLQDPSTVYMSIRGINSVRNTENPVAFVVDGVQTNDATQINQQLTDIERVEILKGPQGSLYGRNAIGGAINIVTKRPTNRLSGDFKFTYENGNERDFSGSLSGAIINDKLLFRVGGAIRNYDGLIENVTLHQKADGFNDQTVFGKLYFMPTDGLNIELRASHYHILANDYYFKKVGLGQINHEDSYDVIETPQGISKVNDDEVSLKVDYDLGFAKLTSVSAYSHNVNMLDGDLAISPEKDGQLGEYFNNRAFNEDIRLTSNGNGPLRWVAGVYFLHKKQHAINPVYLGPALVPGTVLPRDIGVQLEDFFNVPNAPGTLLASRKNFDFTNIAYAGYGQADWDFAPTLTLTAGLRYDHEIRKALNLGTLAFNFADGQTEPVPAAQDVALHRQNTYKALQPKISLAWKPSQDMLFYATASRGFRSGGFNNTTRQAFATYPAEKLWNFEIGQKSTFLNGRLRFEAAAFYMIDRNRPDFFFYVVDSTQNIFPIAKSRIDGVEANVTAAPLRGVQISAGLSLMDSKILEIDTTAIDPLHSGLGKHDSYIYHQQFNVSAQYTHHLQHEVEATMGFDFSLKAKNYFWYTNDGFEQEPIPLLNARLALRKGGAEVRVFAENLLNFKYVTAHDPNFAFGFDQDDAYPAPPRRYGVSLSYHF